VPDLQRRLRVLHGHELGQLHEVHGEELPGLLHVI
jgi:hypothetical protein